MEPPRMREPWLDRWLRERNVVGGVILIVIATVGGIAWMSSSREDSSLVFNIVAMVVAWLIGGAMIYNGLQKPAYLTKPMWLLRVPEPKRTPRIPGADVDILAAEWDAACRAYPSLVGDPWFMANGYVHWVEYLNRAHDQKLIVPTSAEQFLPLWLERMGRG